MPRWRCAGILRLGRSGEGNPLFPRQDIETDIEIDTDVAINIGNQHRATNIERPTSTINAGDDGQG